MYIFARNRRLNPGSMRAGVAAAVEGGSKASELIGAPIFVWASVLSPTTGTAMWSMRVDHLDELMAHADTLSASDEFDHWLSSTDGLFDGPFSDVVSEVLHGIPTGPPAAYINVVTGTCANGSIGEGMVLGVDIAEMATTITGNATMFLSSLFGDFGAVGWLTGLPDLAALEADNAALASDPEWVKLVDRAGHAFAPGVTSSLLRRLA
jgi:hypothetical protein